jgi:hypothetical protein
LGRQDPDDGITAMLYFGQPASDGNHFTHVSLVG